jgi:DedD protein
MSIRSFFNRSPSDAERAAPAPADDAAAVHAARVQARRRLIGAVVLLAVGVVVFPWLFDGKPRPLPGDVRMELQRGSGSVGVAPVAVLAADGASRVPPSPPRLPAPLPEPVAETAVAGVSPAAPTAPAAASAAKGTRTGLAAVVAGPSSPAAPVSVPLRGAAVEAAGPNPAVREPKVGLAGAAPAPSAPAAATAKRDKVDTADRPDKPERIEKADKSDKAVAVSAKASAPADAASAPRFVVQVGAFTDPVALREARQKVEKLGLKTYTQVVETDSGKRTRVRVGPFDTRADAEAAGVKIKASGLPAYMLTL